MSPGGVSAPRVCETRRVLAGPGVVQQALDFGGTCAPRGLLLGASLFGQSLRVELPRLSIGIFLTLAFGFHGFCAAALLGFAAGRSTGFSAGRSATAASAADSVASKRTLASLRRSKVGPVPMLSAPSRAAAPPPVVSSDHVPPLTPAGPIVVEIKLSPFRSTPRSPMTLSLIHISEPTRPY